jgi:hypothetical protein
MDDAKQHVQYFLRPGKLTDIGKYEPLAKSLKLENAPVERTVQNILALIGHIKYENLEKTDKKKWKEVFRKRSAEVILDSNVSYGCGESATVFAAFARACGIPTKFITGNREGKSGGHTWAEVLIEYGWMAVDPTNGKMPYDYRNDATGPYSILSESLDAADSAITCYEDWLELEEKRRVRKK